MARQATTASEMLLKAYGRSRDVVAELADETKHFYHDARQRLPENYGTVAILSAALGGCVIGYLAGRRSRSTPSTPAPSRPSREVSPLPGHLSELDIAPFFRFLKLWMLYRVATRD
jgi:hypothetical protein